MAKSPWMEDVTNYAKVDPTIALVCEMDLGKRESRISSRLIC